MRMFVVILTAAMIFVAGTASAQNVTKVVEKFRQEALLEPGELDRCAAVLKSALSQAPGENRSPADLAKAATATMRSKDCFDLWSYVEDEEHPVYRRNTGTQDLFPQVRELGDTLVVTIPTFDSSVDVGSALTYRLQKMPADWRSFVKRIVVDVRGNLGGEIRNLRNALELFAPEAGMDFMRIHFSSGSLDTSVARVQYEVTRGQGPLRSLPFVFLVDGATMSAAEWFIGISRYEWYPHEATIVGVTNTFGKAIFQCTDSVGGFVLQVTCAHWTVEGKDIHGVGIEPDRKLDLSNCKSDYACVIGKLDSVTTQHASQ